MSSSKVPALETEELVKEFRIAGSARPLVAVNGVSVAMAPGEIVAIVGESGSGKSTLGYCLSGHLGATSGHLQVLGNPVDWRRQRGADVGVQMAFQDAYESLDPRWSVERSLKEAVDAGDGNWDDVLETVRSLGLDAEILRAKPSEVSVATQKVLNLVRAVVAGSHVIVADEPTSGLDLQARWRMAEAVRKLASNQGVTLVLISHDMAFVRHLADHVYVMYLGNIVEQGPTADIFNQPRHPYTMALVAAAFRQRSVELSGEIPSPTDRPMGCPLTTRCPFAEARCHEKQELAGAAAHRWACWKADRITLSSGATDPRNEGVDLCND